ncbi:MAG TPA: glutamate racemase [Candidatus Dormibacteraeota bacterium]|nr:glutamate racemase [Candidatus Dormibacteraeota bacterium]
MLGLFDSGLGGLSVLRQVRAALPYEDILFLADQANVPYGDRSEEELYRYLRANLAWLEAQGAQAIVMACNTSCAVAQRRGWPQTLVPVLDLIESASTAIARRGFREIAVIATAATVRTGAYGTSIRARIGNAHVTEIAAPALVPLVEAGKSATQEARRAVADVCERVPKNCEAAVLACTHYPALDAHFAEALGSTVARIDPAFVQAERTVALAIETSLQRGESRTRCATTGDLERFDAQLNELLGADERRIIEAVRLEYERD